MTGKVYTEDEIANMGDDELMGMAVMPQVEMPEVVVEESDPDDTVVQPTAVVAAAVEESADAAADPGDDDDTGVLAAADDEDGVSGGETGGVSQPVSTTAPADTKDTDPTKTKKLGEETKPGEVVVSGEIDYKAAYELIMKPFKANGKEVKLQSPDEVVRLVQMGANYTKKLQALQPNLKLLKMLENNGLLTEGKLSYLIDLDKKNPAAIQKFIKESGVDPLDIDTTAEPSYAPGNHRVSDEEMNFNAALDDLMVDPAGQETIVVVNKTWDQPSKAALMKEPQLLQVISEQRQSGIYKKITDEVDRRKVLGTLQMGQPFIQTYMTVGKEMDAQGLLDAPQSPAAAQPSRVVETRVAAPKPATVNDAKARAASPTNTTPRKAAVDFNPLSMSDEDFEKNSELAKRL